MSITDELRSFTKDPMLGYASQSQHIGQLTAIADHIDAAHERLCSRSRSNGYSDGFTDGFNDIESWIVDHEDAMTEHGWVRLPKDADGVPIRFGDKVTVPWSGRVYEVSGFSYTQQLAGGERTVWVDVYNLDKMRNVPLCGVSSCHHYHATTVEDLLCELLDKVDDDRAGQAEIIAEYATKLRLADDGKEQ